MPGKRIPKFDKVGFLGKRVFDPKRVETESAMRARTLRQGSAKAGGPPQKLPHQGL